MALNPKEIVGTQTQPSSARTVSASSVLSREEQERLTMQARIEAFFRQSGGPNNPQIKKVLERHLLYGKDHGPPGKRETLEDVFIDTVVKDPSNLVIFKWVQQARLARQRRAAESAAGAEHVQRLETEIQALRKELAEVKEVMRRVVEQATSVAGDRRSD